jgi:hypothetical protein
MVTKVQRPRSKVQSSKSDVQGPMSNVQGLLIATLEDINDLPPGHLDIGPWTLDIGLSRRLLTTVYCLPTGAKHAYRISE